LRVLKTGRYDIAISHSKALARYTGIFKLAAVKCGVIMRSLTEARLLTGVASRSRGEAPFDSAIRGAFCDDALYKLTLTFTQTVKNSRPIYQLSDNSSYNMVF